MATKAEYEKIRKIKKAYLDKLLAKKNVVGVGIGAKLKEGVPTGELAIRVYVKKKVNRKDLKEAELIPVKLEGVPVDVVEVGEPIPYSYIGRERPAIGGDSIGHFQVTAGTLGYLMRDKTDGTAVILSNNHVLANCDAVNHTRAATGDCIIQPGSVDGGTCAADQIATLKRWVRLAEVGQGSNLVDAAIAQPLVPGDVRNIIHEIGCVSQWRGVTNADVVLNSSDPDNVQKSGRTTEYTTGKITDIDATITINYGVFHATHHDVIVTDNMASPGDSGSLLVDMDRKALGLLFGGSPGTVVYYSKIANVLNALDLEFLPCIPPCLIGPFHCIPGGPWKRCFPGGPLMCLPGGPKHPCSIGGPIYFCRIGGPMIPKCPVGPEILVCPISGPGLCKKGPLVGCMAGPELLIDLKERIINPADILGQIVIDADRLTHEQKADVANLVNKLREI